MRTSSARAYIYVYVCVNYDEKTNQIGTEEFSFGYIDAPSTSLIERRSETLLFLSSVSQMALLISTLQGDFSWLLLLIFFHIDHMIE